jgi:hypothetical protein
MDSSALDLDSILGKFVGLRAEAHKVCLKADEPATLGTGRRTLWAGVFDTMRGRENDVRGNQEASEPQRFGRAAPATDDLDSPSLCRPGLARLPALG